MTTPKRHGVMSMWDEDGEPRIPWPLYVAPAFVLLITALLCGSLLFGGPA